ncbi:MAG: hypothetical protein ACE5NP_00275 [Anaerolineae bacterium]
MLEDVLIILAMFALRIGVPILITISVGLLISRWVEREEKGTVERPETVVPLPDEDAQTPTLPRPPSEIKDHEPRRAACPAFQQTPVPCWLALQVSGQPLKDECFTCDVYRLRKSA